MADGLSLGFDTSAAHCAAALLRTYPIAQDRLVVERIEEMAKGQAERLIPFLEGILAEAGIGWADLCAIGVGIGPGNFTGVRIAVAAARGLALSLGIPAIGISTLEAVALDQPRPLWVIEDARRGEAYVQHFTETGAEPPFLRPLAEFAPPAGEAVTGSAAGEQALAPRVALATAIARIAASRAGKTQPRPAPLYLRGADAAPPSDPPPVLID